MCTDILFAQIYSSVLLKFLVQENVQKNRSTLFFCRVNTSSPQLPNLFWVTASDGFVPWNENLLNFQMFIWSKTHIKTPVNECFEISVKKPLLPAPKKPPNNPTRNMCAKSTWVNWTKAENIYVFLIWIHYKTLGSINCLRVSF